MRIPIMKREVRGSKSRLQAYASKMQIVYTVQTRFSIIYVGVLFDFFQTV